MPAGAAPLLSRAVTRLLQVLMLNPGRVFFQRELARLTGEPLRGVQQGLARLIGEDVAVAVSMGGRPAYRANEANPFFLDLQRIAIRSLGIPEALDAAGVTALKVVVFGPYAKGVAAPGSDLDVLIVGRERTRGDAERALASLSEKVGREISIHIYDHARYLEEAAQPASFVAAIAAGPTIDLRGTL